MWGCLQWLDVVRNKAAKADRVCGRKSAIRARKYGPEAQNRRKWSAGRRGILSWDVHAGAHAARDAGRLTCVA
jgi:hypothetical protein